MGSACSKLQWPQVGDRPICSASMPSVVLGMLDALDVQPGQSVLEIGTGTGFNAVLLAELVGPTGRRPRLRPLVRFEVTTPGIAIGRTCRWASGSWSCANTAPPRAPEDDPPWRNAT
jgi:predicted methyltransferase